MAYDVIVIGTGGVGSAAAFHAARRGARVLGLDRFPGGHDQGSSHGHTRIIRMAYFEHPDYVPLLRRAYTLWRELEHLAGEQLYSEVGLIEIGPPQGAIIPGVLKSAQQYNLPIEQLDQAAIRARFPGFVLPEGDTAVFEHHAGFLFVEKCVLAHLAEARKAGTELRVGESVTGWTVDGGHVRVSTDKGTYEAGKLIITAGAWSQKLLQGLKIPLQIRRKHLHWYETKSDVYLASRGCPGFFYERPEGYFYGFPQVDERGIKVAEHSGGTVVETPLGDDRSVEAQDRSRVEAFLAQNMPQVAMKPTGHAVCYYTMSADEHFIVDRHPEHENVSFVAGLSGHGFKFTCVLGEIMADLAMNGKTTQPIEFLNCQREGLRKG